jgi:pyruvate dehydrogenase E1 component beta subunit
MSYQTKYTYGTAMLSAFEYLLEKYPEVFIIGQGLWSPWYVGNSMTGLDKKFGTERIIDTPVSESACTGAAVGASLCGMKPIVVHPRLDFTLYAMDAIVNQAAKWSHMTGGQAHPEVTIRAIINRGGEQGAQHSQSLHSWFAHIPGLRVVMPATVVDARDLLIASVLCPDPVVFIDDRWLYGLQDTLPPIVEINLSKEGPKCLLKGENITIVSSGYSTYLATEASKQLAAMGIMAEVIDLRILNPLHTDIIVDSVLKTHHLLVIDGGWTSCGVAGEVMASVVEKIPIGSLKKPPRRLTLPPAPAPASRALENKYYPTVDMVVNLAKILVIG